MHMNQKKYSKCLSKMTKGPKIYVFPNFLAPLMMIIFYDVHVLNATALDGFYCELTML